MSVSTSFLKFCAVASALCFGSASAFAAELTLHKVPADVSPVSYGVTGLHAKARALYVSSGNSVAANAMIDNQPSSTYSFAADDATPVVIIDLGSPVALQRVSALYSNRHVSVDVFVLQSLATLTNDSVTGPSDLPQTIRIDSALAKLTPVGSILDEGTGRATADFPQMTGRYIIVKWTPTHQERAFEVAEVSVVGKAKETRLTVAQVSAAAGAGDRAIADGKDIGDGKDAKEIPAEGPAEGPAVGVPQPPPFVFVPLVTETSP